MNRPVQVPAGLAGWLPLSTALRSVSLLLLGIASASACTLVNDADHYDRIANVKYREPQEWLTVLFNNGMPATRGCPSMTPIRIRHEPALTGLTYWGNVEREGVIYAAFEWHPQSPLVTFALIARAAAGGMDAKRIPIMDSRPIETSFMVRDDGWGFIHLESWIWSRGGPMSSAPHTFVGTATTTFPDYPGIGPIQHSLSLGVNVEQLSCTLVNDTLTLDDVVANDLPATGSTAKEKAARLVMTCPAGGIPIKLTVADSNAAGPGGSELEPAAGSNAGGVKIQLLNGGVPVQFGTEWDHGHSVGGGQLIPLSARYIRTADPIDAGDIIGEAILTADYR